MAYHQVDEAERRHIYRVHQAGKSDVLGAAPVPSGGALAALEKTPRPRPRLNIHNGFATLTVSEKQRFLTPVCGPSGNSLSVRLGTRCRQGLLNEKMGIC